MGAGERPRLEAAEMGAAAHLAPDQPRFLQRLDVLGGGLQRDRERLGQLAHGPFAAGKIAQHLPACGVAQRVKDGIEPVGSLKFNHVVEYIDDHDDCQPIG